MYNLTYFDLAARAEQVRWILVEGGAKWIDTRVQFEDWPALKPSTCDEVTAIATVFTIHLYQYV